MSAPRRVTLDRFYEGAHLDDAWDLWTTKAGIESWWGPEGFGVTVDALTLTVGGTMRYTMRATAPGTIAFMRDQGMPIARAHEVTFTEITPKTRIVYDHLVDFVPDRAPYVIEHAIDLVAERGGVRVVLSFAAMHDDEWTSRAQAGWTQELGKLGRALSSRGSAQSV